MINNPIARYTHRENEKEKYHVVKVGRNTFKVEYSEGGGFPISIGGLIVGQAEALSVARKAAGY
jgi:hypothetical protein